MSALEKITQNANAITGGIGSANDILNTNIGSLIGKDDNNKTSLDTLKGRAAGYAKVNRFAVSFSIPPTLAGYYSDIENITLMARETALPSFKLGTFEHRNIGPVIKLPNDIIFEPSNLSFYVDREMKVRQFFQDWIMTITSKNMKAFNYFDEYSRDITIHVMDEGGNVTYSVKLVGAYPTGLSDIQLSAENSDQLMIQNVSFTYQSWREVNPETQEDYTIGGILSSMTGGISDTVMGGINFGSGIIDRASGVVERFKR